MNVLDEIVATTRAELAARRAAVPLAEVQRAAEQRRAGPDGDRRSFQDALARSGLSLIAEHKRRSPSAGVIRSGTTLEQVVCAYECGGAAAASILTESANFGGSLDDLRAARRACALPLLRKDFVVDAYQLYEAAAAGADAVLLIVAALPQLTLVELHEQAGALGLDALVEVHDAEELERAVQLEAQIIGVNNRDLTTLQVDTSLTFELRSRIPSGTLVVAESGFSAPEQMARLRDAGVDAVLVGEALMRSADLESACRALSAA